MFCKGPEKGLFLNSFNERIEPFIFYIIKQDICIYICCVVQPAKRLDRLDWIFLFWTLWVLFEICFFFKIFIFLFFCSNFFSRETPGPSASMYIYFACLNRSGPNFVWHFTCPPGNVWRWSKYQYVPQTKFDLH